MPKNHPLFTDEAEVREAEDREVFKYLRRKEGLFRKNKLFDALDKAQPAIRELKLDPWDGELLAGLATAFLRADRKVYGWFRKRDSTSYKKSTDVDRLHQLLGLAAAEKYLAARTKDKDRAKPLAVYDGLETEVEVLLQAMVKAGLATESEAAFAGELVVSNLQETDPVKAARVLAFQALAKYESLLEVEPGADEIPKFVRDKAIAKAAFLRLRADDLDELAVEYGLEGLETREAVAEGLAAQFKEDHQRVARMVLRQEDGDPQSGIVTRLIPIQQPPSLDSAQSEFAGLKGRWFETKVAQWFVFRDVKRPSDDELTLEGRVRGFSVRPAEIGDEARLNANPKKDDLAVVLRTGVSWAETSARRVSELGAVRAVLRRTDVAVPRPALPQPTVAGTDEKSIWDPRTLWLLSLMQREFRTLPLEMTNTVMVNFERPNLKQVVPDNRPAVHAIRLKGSQLQDHPEVCSLISTRRHMLDVQVRLAYWVDKAKGSKYDLNVRVSWAGDHLAVMSGDSDGDPLPEVHAHLVQVVRDAADRDLDLATLQALLDQVSENAGLTESDELSSVMAASEAGAG